MRKLSDIPLLDRPREKLLAKGQEALTDVELLAAFLGRGTKRQDVVVLALKLLETVNSKNGTLCCNDLLKIDGFGEARAAQVLAALEFARRRIHPDGTKIRQAMDILPLLAAYAAAKQEHLLCISLNGAHEVIKTRVVTIGLVNRTQVHPREVFADPLIDRAAAIIVAHNHPSGELTPSRDDIEVTNRLKDAGKLLGIELLDHIIVTTRGHYSFCEAGMM